MDSIHSPTLTTGDGVFRGPTILDLKDKSGFGLGLDNAGLEPIPADHQILFVLVSMPDAEMMIY